MASLQKYALALFLLLALTAPLYAASPEKAGVLWRIASGCARNMRDNHTPMPCDRVDLDRGYVVLKDILGSSQFLLIPTRPVSGIESPELLKKNAANYWQPAWEARGLVSQRLGKNLPDRDVGLAINSLYGRSQSQLHIHIDCLQPKVITTLAAEKIPHDGAWHDIRFPHLHRYDALYVDALNEDPFKLLAAHAGDMARETLVVASLGDGFVLLAPAGSLKHGDNGSGEELLDHACRAAGG